MFEMTRLLRNLLVVMMLGIVSAGALAQKGQGQDKRPKKEEIRVTTNDRKEKPPPRNTNQPKPDKNKKP